MALYDLFHIHTYLGVSCLSSALNVEGVREGRIIRTHRLSTGHVSQHYSTLSISIAMKCELLAWIRGGVSIHCLLQIFFWSSPPSTCMHIMCTCAYAYCCSFIDAVLSKSPYKILVEPTLASQLKCTVCNQLTKMHRTLVVFWLLGTQSIRCLYVCSGCVW
jgi:hypothetical protein